MVRVPQSGNENGANGKLTIAWRAISLLTFFVASWRACYVPLHSDEIYGFTAIQGSGPWASPLHVLTYPFSNELLSWMLRVQGRVVPFGTFVYHLGYWVAMRAAALLGLNVVLTYAVLKMIMLAAGFVGLYLWLRLILRPSLGDSAQSFSLDATIFASFIFGVGLRLDSISRNGLTTFAFLTFSALLLCFWLPIGLVAVVRRHPRMAYVATAATGVVVGLSYELHYVSLVTVVLTFWLMRRDLGVRRAWSLVWVTVGGFSATFVATRLLVHSACAAGGCYEGTAMTIGPAWVRATVMNIGGSLPMKLPSKTDRAAGINWNNLDAGQSLLPWAVAAVFAAAVMWWGITPVARANGVNRGMTRLHAQVVGVLLALALVTAAAMALSSLAQEWLVWPRPYRGYAVIWFSLAAALAATIQIVRIAGSSVLLRFTRGSASFVAAAVTLYVAPYTWHAHNADWELPVNQSAFAYYGYLVSDPQDSTVNQRCAAIRGLGDNRIARAVRDHANRTYEYLHRDEFCPLEMLSSP